MATEREVTIRLNVTGADRAATDTQKVSKAFDAAAEAQKRLSRADQEFAVRRELDRLRPGTRDLPEVGGGGGAGGGGGLGSLGRFARAAFLISAAEQGLQGLGRGAQDLAQHNVGLAKSIELLSGNFIDALPIIGGFARGIRDIADVMSGAPQSRAIAQRAVGFGLPQIGLAGEVSALQFGAGVGVADIRRQARDAAIDRQAAAAFTRSLTPDRLAFYRPDVAAGLATAQTGEARFQLDLARAAAAGPAGRVAGREAEAARAAAAVRAAEAQVGRSERRFGLDQRRLDTISALLTGDNTSVLVEGGFARRQTLRGAQSSAQAGVILSGAKLEQDRLALNRALEESQKRQNDLLDARKQKAQADLNVSLKELDVQRDRLNLINERVGQARAGATAAGMAAPGEVQGAVDAVKRIQQFGYGALSPEEQADVNRFFPRFGQRQAEAFGRSLPAFQEGSRLTDEFLPDLEKQRQVLEDAIRVQMAKSQELLAQAVENALGPAVDRLTDAIIRAMVNKIKEATEKILRDQAQQGLQGQQAQQPQAG